MQWLKGACRWPQTKLLEHTNSAVLATTTPCSRHFMRNRYSGSLNSSTRVLNAILLQSPRWKRNARSHKTNNEGYILQIAVITFSVVIIGVAAYASRTTSGFFGAINQSVNREARDTAESAITEFQDALNRPENRYLLVKGPDVPWSATDASLKNPCTSVNIVNSIPDISSAPYPSAEVVSRFSADPSLNASSFKNLISGDSKRQFVVEKVEYIYDRDPSSSVLGRIFPSDSGYDWSSLSTATGGRGLYDGGTRTLLRVTVVARVTRNGTVSQARVAREFEIVPKCCGRSFGNTYGGKNWGRDSGQCLIIKEQGGGNGLITTGGLTTGASGTSWRITDENGNSVTKAKCWAGNLETSSDMSGNPTAKCTNNQVVFTGSPGTTFTPSKFSINTPLWYNTATTDIDAGLNSATTSTPQQASLAGSNTYYIYFNPSLKRLCVRKLGSLTSTTFSSSPSCSSSSFESLLGNGSTVDPCSYKNISYPWGTTNSGIPYYEVSCRLRNVNSDNNTSIVFDTSNMKLNLHFDSSSYSGEYMGGGGGTTFVRRHCRKTSNQLSIPPEDLSNPCTINTSILDYTTSGTCPELVNPVNSSQRLKCPKAYSISELFNIYSTGSGSFNMQGGNSTVGFNLIAPYATVIFKGGGNADPNFMGRILAKDIALSGNIKIRTLSGNPSYCDSAGAVCPPTGGPPFFDFIARSFSHASGF